ncbi:MAG: flavin reductase family protein [Anaerocolumna aminovalerica]|uniref:NADH-FMN oxidoreductase RutF, flavin reductase (DIM6/NTAB) family n=1 Tax=Anaerocolumna aminovalerica TaxID=1527 RepID=A0A1I5CW48_9FIRM|nr:flavin reductase family protein [Anaerocolumna aminovalerica]MBU5332176.1 flavin reductase family protein [Anaerocolumna aminovalerica]MDU6266357.1 flavin reductase family protein [Anaerocolumna aminovalerica]SFN91163.1 NADH-FMN oxidoreductase RutF, flavin reductase (DIM6/NTAB) family [Anaerocolumna aminovalerica]
MNEFKEITAAQLEGNPFQMIGKEWMLVTAEKEGTVNTMTASWGGLGIMWGKNVAFVTIRPQRYTKEFVDFSDTFSLSFYDESYRKTLAYLGRVSGRDENKIEKSELTLAYDIGTPYFEEANTVLICKKLFAQPYSEESFIDKSIMPDVYPDKDFHTLYVADIIKVLVKESQS